MRKLYLFKEAWNFGNNVHIDFDRITKEKWFNSVKSANLGYASYEPNNYRIVNGIVTINGNVLDSFSYIIEIDEDLIDDPEGTIGKQVFKYWHCYFIKSITKRSGYSILSCDTDVWGTFYPYAELSNIHVSRCNRNIGRGRFDPINAFDTTDLTENWYRAVGGDETTTTGINSLDDDKVSIVFTANCVMAQTGSSKSNVTGSYIFARPLSYFKDLADANNVSTLEFACRVISGITGISDTSFLKSFDAQVMNVHILPSAYVQTTNATLIFDALTPYTGTTKVTSSFELVKPSLIKYALDLNTADLSPNYQWTLGVKDEGLELLRSTKDELGYLEVSMNYDGVKIVVRQGKEQYDLTSHFTMGLIGKAEQTDTLEKISNAVHFVGSMVNNLFSIVGGVKSYQEKGDMGRLAGSITNYANFLTDALTNKASANTSRSQSDAYLTFNYQNHKVYYPFYLTYKRSAIDEEQHARLYGASFDATISWFGDIYNYPVFYATDYDTTFTYVQCEAEIKKAPTDACNYIKSVLAGGVWLGTGVEDNIDLMI